MYIQPDLRNTANEKHEISTAFKPTLNLHDGDRPRKRPALVQEGVSSDWQTRVNFMTYVPDSTTIAFNSRAIY